MRRLEIRNYQRTDRMGLVEISDLGVLWVPVVPNQLILTSSRALSKPQCTILIIAANIGGAIDSDEGNNSV